MTEREAITFLNETAIYFERRPTNGEDSAHWANVSNAENCRKIAAILETPRRETEAKQDE